MAYETFNPADSDFNNKRRANPVRVLSTEKLNSELSADEIKDLTPPFYCGYTVAHGERVDRECAERRKKERKSCAIWLLGLSVLTVLVIYLIFWR